MALYTKESPMSKKIYNCYDLNFLWILESKQSTELFCWQVQLVSCGAFLGLPARWCCGPMSKRLYPQWKQSHKYSKFFQSSGEQKIYLSFIPESSHKARARWAQERVFGLRKSSQILVNSKISQVVHTPLLDCNSSAANAWDGTLLETKNLQYNHKPLN